MRETKLPSAATNRPHNAWLDVVRAAAALSVVAGHLKAVLLEGIGPQSGLLSKAFNLATNQATPAVMVFFVLSGYLVGGQIVAKFESQTWSWIRYAIARLTRLWVVLIPALALTATLDFVGTEVLHLDYQSTLFAARPESINVSGGSALTPLLSLKTLLGNLFFLQNFVVPTFGTDDPLWSLSYEFWFYATSPFLVMACWRGSRWNARLLGFLVLLGSLWAFSAMFAFYGALWILGLATHRLALKRGGLRNGLQAKIYLLASVFVFAAVLYLPRYWDSQLGNGLAVGGAFSIVLFNFNTASLDATSLRDVASWVAAFSFTMYATHLPFLAFLVSFLYPGKVPLSLAGIAAFVLVLASTIAFSFLIYLLFERHTPRVRRLVSRLAYGDADAEG